MAPGNKDRHPGHTGTIPKTKARNNCNVPQEAVTPTRRDMASNLVTTSLDWVPVSEYNPRSNNCNQSRKQTNNTSEQEYTDLDTSVTFESGFGRFVPVRPQPRVLPLTVQNRELTGDRDHINDDASSSGSHSLHPYAHQLQNGLGPHSNHAAAAVMIVNPTTPNTVAGSVPQSFIAQNQNRKNFARNLNSNRHNFEGNNNTNNNTAPTTSNSRSGKAVNLMNNMYDPTQGNFNNINENNHAHRESARALGEAIVAACPDAASVERRLGQIREYIRVTSSLVDTMRNSEDEAFIEHTKEEYDELIEMVQKLKESEEKLESLLHEKNAEAFQDATQTNQSSEQDVVVRPISVQSNGSAYSENELWQNEIKNKMEMSEIRLSALKQQQKRLLKYQEEAKHQLEELNRQSHDQVSNSHENFVNPQNANANYMNSNRMYATNQIGVATTLPQDNFAANNMEAENVRSNHSVHRDDRFSLQGNIGSSEEAAGGSRDSEAEDESALHERGRMLQLKLRELQRKKQHMENLVSEFQKLQMAASMGVARNTYSSSDESADEEPSRKCNKSEINLKNEDPFKLMEIKAIKTALQKTKDLMRSVETFEADHLSGVPDETFHMPPHANKMHDNKSECGSVGGWSGEGSARVRNTIAHPHKLTNETHNQAHQRPHHSAHAHSHEANINSLQELAQELRMETEKIMGERARIKDMVTNRNKEANCKQKKVNEEAVSSSCPGPAERRQMQLRALLAEKQRELEALLNKEVMNASSEVPKVKTESRAASVANQSFNSEPEEPESSEQIQMDSQNSRETENFRGGGDSALGSRSINTAPSQLASAYCSDTDSVSRGKSNQRNRARRRTTQERHTEDINIPQQNIASSSRHEPPREPSSTNMTPPVPQNAENTNNMPYPHMPPPCWNSKSNQDMRNQFTQNSHSQTMDRLLGTPQMPFPPTMPFNMMMPYGGMMCGCGCVCGAWGAWCWHQLLLHQRDIHQLREQVTHLEERWRAETASHTLNNQVPPGNRANNYWDNFRSYSRQNLLSANSKTNADGHLGASPASPHPLVARSHNALSRAPAAAPAPAAPPPAHPPRNLAYERSLSFSSAPDVLNLNHDEDTPRQEPRNLNITNPIPEIIQSHSNLNARKKPTAKPSKNSANRNYNMLDFSQTSNINIASTSEVASPNPNLASTSRDVQDKTSKLFDLLRENIYSEVTTLIGANESHPDFLIQLFKELKHISSDRLRQKVLQSIRQILTQYSNAIETQSVDATLDEFNTEVVTTTAAEPDNFHCEGQNACSSTVQIDNPIVRFLLRNSEEIFTHELLETFANILVNDSNNHAKKLLESLLKYDGMRVCDVSSDIIENLSVLIESINDGDESTQHANEVSEPSILQDVAGSLNLFSSSENLQQINCPYDMWPGHVHMEVDSTDANDNSQEGKSDLITCSEMLNGDLAEADQTCRSDVSDNMNSRQENEGNAEALPDVVDTEEVTPTEAEAEWLGLDRVPTRLHMEELSEKQKD